MTRKIKCALIGPGNIGTDLLDKLQRSSVLEPVWMVGIDPDSDGLQARPRDGHQDHRRGCGRPDPAHEGRRCADRLRRHQRLRARRERAQAQRAGRADDRPDAGGHRPVLRAAGEPEGAPRPGRDERQHGHLRRPGDDPDGGGGEPRAGRGLRRDRGHRVVASRSAPARARTSTNSRAPRPVRSSRWAAPRRARPSSSSTRPSRR